jgi:hypothetical protein
VLLTSEKGKVRPHKSDLGSQLLIARLRDSFEQEGSIFRCAPGKNHHLILFGHLLQIGLEKTKKALLLLLHQCGYMSTEDTAGGGCATQVS